MVKTLPSIRISDRVSEQIEQAIKKFNAKNIIPFNKANFRRYAYSFLSLTILEDKELPKLQL